MSEFGDPRGSVYGSMSSSYSLMQSDGNIFGEDVVLKSFNIVYSDEDSVEDQKYEKQICWDLYFEDFKF